MGKGKRDVIAYLLDLEDDIRADIDNQPDHIKAAYDYLLGAIGSVQGTLAIWESQERPPPRER